MSYTLSAQKYWMMMMLLLIAACFLFPPFPTSRTIANINSESFNYLEGSYEKIENTPNGTIWCANAWSYFANDCIRIDSSGRLDRDQYSNGSSQVVIPISSDTIDFTIKEFQNFDCCGSASVQFSGHKIELFRWSGSAYQTLTTDLIRHRNISGNAGTTVIGNSWIDMAPDTINTYHFQLNFVNNLSTSTVETSIGSSTGNSSLTWTTSGVSPYFDDYIPSGYEGMHYLVIYTHDYSTVQSKITSIEADYKSSIDIDQDIVATTTWDGPVPFVVSGNVHIDPGVTLTMNPGVKVKFDTSTSSSLIVAGTLDANGTAEGGQIMMTSLDDDYLGDTNGDGTSTTPASGDWGGIIVESGGVVDLNNTIVRYAGGNANSSQIYNDGGALNLTDSRILYGTTYGVKNNSGTAYIQGTELAYNDNGFYVDGGNATATANNIIHDNDSYGIFNNTVNTILAEYNFWGHDSGPQHASSNPLGYGDTVSNNVDYGPWTSDLHYTLGISSVDSREIRWDGTTQYSDQWYAAIDTWNSLGSVNIATDTIITTEDLTVSDVNESDLGWVGQWDPEIGADKLQLNEYYLQYNTNEQIQNTITHELGHALGLHHSYTGNIMYYRQNSQTSLGDQDEDDYYYLWP